MDLGGHWLGQTDHGRSPAPGVQSGVNAFGCCAGPMQFSIVGSSSTWDRYSIDGDDDGATSVCDPADAVPAAARYLRASGAPGDYHAALFGYNHAEWCDAQVLAKAAEYRGSPTAGGDTPGLDSGVLSDVLDNPRITLTPVQQSDLRSGAIDSRLIARLAWIGRQHSVVITALKSDHSRDTVDGGVSNHAVGRAMDIGAVDREVYARHPDGQVRRLGT